MSQFRRSLLGLIIFCFLPSYHKLEATPLLALREAQNCAGCHNPGRSQRPYFERRGTLDCQGCHADPSGGGARNQWGSYYSIDQLPIYRPYKPIDPLQDESRFDLHVDGRSLNWIKPGGERVTLPMSLESSIRVRPFIRSLSFSYSALMLGRWDDSIFRVAREGDRRFRERYAVMIDNLPLNAYARAYRGTPMYGLKRPNHTLWIRQRLGLDQFASTDAFEVGGTPNVPFFRLSQMQGDPYVEAAVRQKGSSYHAGMRGVSFGWHVNTSGWSTQSDFHRIDMSAFGGGATFFDWTVYGERNWRHVRGIGESSPDVPLYLHSSSSIGEYTLAYQGLRGLTLGVIKEELETMGIKGQRENIFIDLHPIPWLQFELWRRKETLARTASDTLGIVHLYADF